MGDDQKKLILQRLVTLLCDKKFVLVDVCCTFALKHNRNDGILRDILDLFEGNGKGFLLLQWALTKEIKATYTKHEIFRGESLATFFMDIVIKNIAKPYVKKILEKHIVNLIESRAELEVDPSRFTKKSQPQKNAVLLRNYSQRILQDIFLAEPDCPIPLRLLFHHIKRIVSLKFPADWHLGVSLFIFLRLICPALITPHQWNLVPDAPPQRATRGLILISKLLQNLANSSLFLKKENYMTQFNDFISENQAGILKYLDNISNFRLASPRESSRRYKRISPPDEVRRPRRKMTLDPSETQDIPLLFFVEKKRKMTLDDPQSTNFSNPPWNIVDPILTTSVDTGFHDESLGEPIHVKSRRRGVFPESSPLITRSVSGNQRTSEITSSCYPVTPRKREQALENIFNYISENLDLILEMLSKRQIDVMSQVAEMFSVAKNSSSTRVPAQTPEQEKTQLIEEVRKLRGNNEKLMKQNLLLQEKLTEKNNWLVADPLTTETSFSLLFEKIKENLWDVLEPSIMASIMDPLTESYDIAKTKLLQLQSDSNPDISTCTYVDEPVMGSLPNSSGDDLEGTLSSPQRTDSGTCIYDGYSTEEDTKVLVSQKVTPQRSLGVESSPACAPSRRRPRHSPKKFLQTLKAVSPRGSLSNSDPEPPQHQNFTPMRTKSVDQGFLVKVKDPSNSSLVRNHHGVGKEVENGY